MKGCNKELPENDIAERWKVVNIKITISLPNKNAVELPKKIKKNCAISTVNLQPKQQQFKPRKQICVICDEVITRNCFLSWNKNLLLTLPRIICDKPESRGLRRKISQIWINKKAWNNKIGMRWNLGSHKFCAAYPSLASVLRWHFSSSSSFSSSFFFFFRYTFFVLLRNKNESRDVFSSSV